MTLHVDHAVPTLLRLSNLRETGGSNAMALLGLILWLLLAATAGRYLITGRRSGTTGPELWFFLL